MGIVINALTFFTGCSDFNNFDLKRVPIAYDLGNRTLGKLSRNVQILSFLYAIIFLPAIASINEQFQLYL